MTVISGKLIVMNTEYGLHISDELEKRMLRCRTPVREAIRERLRQIAIGAGKARRRGKTVALKEPPLRFYVYEGYRIAYQLDAASRRVVVIDIDLLPID
jgi:mRNA-degrading endonuclease RelE of RelBE toxin-antitoxin system